MAKAKAAGAALARQVAAAKAHQARTKAELQRAAAHVKQLKAAQAAFRREQQKQQRAASKALGRDVKRLKAISGTLKAKAAAVAKATKRFVLVDSKTRRYFDTKTREFISRYEQVKRQSGKTPRVKAADNLLALARQRTTAEGRKQVREIIDRRGRAKAAVQSFKTRKARELGVPESAIKVRGESATAREFKDAYSRLSRMREDARGGRLTRAQAKRYAKALIEIGWIDEEDLDAWIDHYTGEQV